MLIATIFASYLWKCAWIGGIPALLATSREPERKALMTSGPALILAQLVTLNGGSPSLPSFSCSCWVPEYEAILRLVPAGTLAASGADRSSSPVAAALPPAQPLRPATP